MSGPSPRRRRPSSSSRKPFHAGSQFGTGQRRPMDRNDRARWRYIVHRHVRAGDIGPRGAWALELLPTTCPRMAGVTPSHARLAADAGISESTVERPGGCQGAGAARLGSADRPERLAHGADQQRLRADTTGGITGSGGSGGGSAATGKRKSFSKPINLRIWFHRHCDGRSVAGDGPGGSAGPDRSENDGGAEGMAGTDRDKSDVILSFCVRSP